MSTEINSLLSSTPDIRHGQPCISGTGISVKRIAILHNLGHSTEDIVRKYEHLTPAGVHAALAYYFANKQQIDSASSNLLPKRLKGNSLTGNRLLDADPSLPRRRRYGQ